MSSNSVGNSKKFGSLLAAIIFPEKLSSRSTQDRAETEQQFYLSPDKFDMTDTISEHAIVRTFLSGTICCQPRDRKQFARKLNRSAAVQCLDSSERLNDVQSRRADGGQETPGQSHQQGKAQRDCHDFRRKCEGKRQL